MGEQPAVGGAGWGCGGLCCTREAPRTIFQEEPMHSAVLDLRAATESLCPGVGGGQRGARLTHTCMLELGLCLETGSWP